MNVVHQPSGLIEALALLDQSRTAGGAAVLAGATDVYPVAAARNAWLQPDLLTTAVDISRIDELRGVVSGPAEIVFGALATWTEIAEARLPPAFAGFQAAARQVGGRQIQNRGTIGGNLCNASPAADGVPPLIALDSEVELASVVGRRRMPLAAFVQGNRKTALAPGELLTQVIVPKPHDAERGVFLKLGARSYLVISIASVAANLRLDENGRIAAARIALGACSAAPIRLSRIEREAVGRRPDEVDVTLGPDDGVSPIDDVRASADYRRRAAAVLVQRAILACATNSAMAA